MTNVRCNICGRNGNRGVQSRLPPDWTAECDRCVKSAPKRPTKTQRKCAGCGDPVIVMHVPGSHRLVCNKCSKMTHLNKIEALNRELRKSQDRVEKLSGQVAKSKTDLDAALREEEKSKQAELAELQEKIEILEKKPEDDFLERLRLKVRDKYGDTDAKNTKAERQKLHDFYVWLLDEKGYFGEEGDTDVAALVKEYENASRVG